MTRTTPRLYAPTIDAVELVIEGRDDAEAMVADDEPGWWRCGDELEPGGELRYRFRLRSKSWFSDGEEVEVLDPACRAVSDDGAWSIDAPEPHREPAWHHDDQQLAPDEALAIYELYPRDFASTPGRQLDGVCERLDHLVDLGVNAIQLLPIERGPPVDGWGYTPLHVFAVDPDYGGQDDLAHLVDEAHGRGLRVLVDGIFNHVHQECPLARIDHDLWFHHEPKDPERAWGPQFNYRHRLGDDGTCPARSFARARLRRFVQGLHVDGIRFDAAAQIDDRELLDDLRREAQHLAGDKPFACIAEHLPEDPTLVGPDGAVDRCWRRSFTERIRALLRGEWDGDELVAAIDPRADGYRSGHDVVNYLACHDTGHTLRHLLDAGIDEGAALHRMELGYTLLLTAVGAPMLWMGDEFGAAGRGGDDEAQALPWSLLAEDERRQNLHARIRGLLALRRDRAALRGDGIDVIARDDERRVLVYQRWDDSGGRLLVVVHADDGHQEIAFDAPDGGSHWHERTLDVPHDADEAGVLHLQLDPWQALVLDQVSG